MALRPERFNKRPNPNYDTLNGIATLKIHHGGSFLHYPKAEYVGGCLSCFDYFEVDDLCINLLDKLCELLGYLRPKKYYRIDRNKCRLMIYQTDFVMFGDGYTINGNELNLYVEAEKCNAQIGSLNTLKGGELKMNEVNGENQNSENSEGFEESEYDINSDNNGDSSDDTGDEQPRDELDVAEKNIVRLEQNSEDATKDESGEDGAEEEDAVQSGDDFSSDVGSEGEDAPKFPVFKPTFDPVFEIGMIFSNKSEFREAVHSHACYRAKNLALKEIEGSAEEQYTKLWDYAEELRRSNPGSTILMQMADGDGAAGERKFEKFYVCFEALKQGFLSGCRPVIGVDGCHLKGPHGGVLLSAVSVDPNNNLYPIAYAVDLNHENFVHHCYMVDTYLAVYKPAIHPVNGPKLWAKIGFIPPLPPNFGRSVGKPSRARRLEPDEPTRKTKKKARGRKQPAKLSRQPYRVTCTFCGRIGHNKKGCELRKSQEEGVQTPSPAEESAIGGSNQSKRGKLTARKRTSNTSGKEQLVSSQDGTVQSSVPVLLKGGRKFVTMSNLSAAVAGASRNKNHDSKGKK
ncbi:hypothetical protein Sango_0811000 [Sesamum angolense]|uniref:PB1-like domain-containing protein n=1 Tax=Sesamum angolense TaxID=2727404 RepID=A0AAE1X340_9LAMI|nr:hypothetical protein Sango_0811000 [Sesamum angolense]